MSGKMWQHDLGTLVASESPQWGKRDRGTSSCSGAPAWEKGEMAQNMAAEVFGGEFQVLLEFRLMPLG